jgi:prenylcysteine alpha-carboxyl methylesterase
MNGEESLSSYSPEIVAKESSAQTIALLPPIFLMHGTDDYSIPSSSRFVHMPYGDVYLRQ